MMVKYQRGAERFMELLEKKIQKDGIVKAGNVLKVDHFLNHQMDIALFNEMGKEFKRLFADRPVNKILTIEASGIGIACIAAQYFQVPVVFAKKAQSINIDGEVYSTKIESFTHKRVYDVIVSRKYLGPEDHILIIDDFLANGCAVNGLLELIESAGASVEGIGIVIEKGQQMGGKLLREKGYHVESLAIIEHMDEKTGEICFRH
jgi:xanthine phosphoribosyltransferase